MRGRLAHPSLDVSSRISIFFLRITHTHTLDTTQHKETYPHFRVTGVVQEQEGEVAQAEARRAGEDEEAAGGGRVQGRRAARPPGTSAKFQRGRLQRSGGRLKAYPKHLRF